jgi:hypothetical protein
MILFEKYRNQIAGKFHPERLQQVLQGFIQRIKRDKLSGSAAQVGINLSF